MAEIVTTDAILAPGGVAPWYGVTETSLQLPELDPGELANYEIVFPKFSFLLRIASTFPAWIRIYSTAAARTADASRTFGVGQQNGMGLMAEVACSVLRPVIRQSPVLLFDNDDVPQARVLYLAVLNRDSVVRSPLITITHLPLED